MQKNKHFVVIFTRRIMFFSIHPVSWGSEAMNRLWQKSIKLVETKWEQT